MTNKIKDILKTHKYLLLSFFLPVLLLEGIAIAEKIQPFGSESFLIVDALHQYLPFFADYQEKLKSMDSMFYSFHAGLGYNFLGLWAYYLASPLNLVIALVSKESHCAASQLHFILENAVERMRYPLLRSEWHMDYAVIWLATVGILCGWKS